MDNNIHSIFIQVSKDSHAFIDGIPDKCEHDYRGDEVFFTQSGETIYWHTYRQWARYNSVMRNRLIYEHQIEIDDPINGGAVTCKKCKKIFSPPIF
jgi:hypothetical protein